MEIIVENIKCGGCMNSIRKTLNAIPGVEVLSIDADTELIQLKAPESLRPEIVTKLASMGYPERGHNSLFSKAKSYVSCAIGRITDSDAS